MSTRSKTKLAAASASKTASTPVKTVKKVKDRSPKQAQSVQSESDQQQEKENVKELKVNPKTSPAKSRPSRSAPPVYCTCQKGDDGTPMVLCEECKVWHHFSCVDLKEGDAEDINIYICPSCTKTSGRRTAMLWEGPDAVEEDTNDEITPIPRKQVATKRFKQDSPVELPSESEEDPSSADEYVVDDQKAKRKVAGKRQTRRLSFSSESDSDTSDGPKQSRRNRAGKISQSPAPSHSRLKRKEHHASHTPPAKRKKPDAPDLENDPTRKYCLSKLEELFRDIFLRYPHVRVEAQGDSAHDIIQEKIIVQKPLNDLTEEEKLALIDESKDFAAELEKCVFEIYSDKQGQPSAGSKYKDRFRMLQFNLSKVDRVIIHQRISSALITPKEISLMSSTDLANEETKQSIKIAEKEALEYSILTPTVIPRAKITHKGLEDIEDVHGGVTSIQEEEHSRREEEERREKERMARLQAQTRQRTASVSVPPESPVVPHSAQSWGAPPVIPIHAMLPGDSTPAPASSFANENSPTSTSFMSTASDNNLMEPELNLADFINIDDEVPNTTEAPKLSSSSPDRLVTSESSTSVSDDQVSNTPTPIPTGISPFATKSDQHGITSFDLDAVWNAPKGEDSTTPTSPLPPPPQEPQLASSVTPKINIHEKDVTMESDTVETNDQDFDMFLDEKDLDSTAASPEAQQAALDALPQVWTGKITMPLDSTIPQETPVIARQIGGRPLEHDSTLWKTLLPSALLRIDGRVPVDNSSKFLLQMRMNVTKELIAVAFSPAPQSNEIGFQILSDFLIAKGRHGLIFPWGSRPKEHYPGRELYIIPLLSSDPLPDYMELLDNLHLPNTRRSNLLIGIWVLNKGKLAPPPPLAPSPTPAIPPILQNIQLPLLNNPTSLPSTSGVSPPPPLPANIAAEVASLTPEQIQLMIRTLTGNGTIPLPVLPPPPTQQVPQVLPVQPHPPSVPPAVPTQAWSSPSHGYGPMYPPQNISPHHNPIQPHDRHDSQDSHPWPTDREGRGGRGWRGRGRGRGRGDDVARRPVDSGWPRKVRGDAGAGPSSPTRRW